jgi:hypothetical protein
MESEGRNQTDHRWRDGRGGDRQIVVLCGACPVRQPISSRANLLENTRLRHPGQCAGVNPLTSDVAGTQDRPLLGEAEKLADGGAAALRSFAYTH